MSPLTTTAISADGGRRVLRSTDAAHPKVDCFYVYPTVSTEKTANANLRIQLAERAVAFDQASRFSSVCRVYAPMYRQLTLAAIAGSVAPTSADLEEAYSSMLSGFRDYLAHDNHGRGIVFIGHSQGAALLIRLLARVVDSKASLRHRLVSAILLGGNVTVPVGKAVGGSFKHIPACVRRKQLGCVVAYSSFLQPPPPNSLFARAGQGVSLLNGQSATSDLQVLCANPAALGGGSAPLDAYFPNGAGAQLGLVGTQPVVSTPWITYPGRYRGRCMHKSGASWLQVTPAPSDSRPVVSQVLGAAWGTHLADVNLTLGNLVSLVRSEARAYAQRH